MPAYVLDQKIIIGISACCFGAPTRWNHRGWDRLACLGREAHDYRWLPVCPEVAAGLGVPRDPVRLVSGNGDDFWQGRARVKNRRGQDVSALVRAACEETVGMLRRSGADACVFMEGSPSCGVYRTTLKEHRLGKSPGVFGSRILGEDLFLIPAADLESPWKWWDWSRRLHAFVWLKRHPIRGAADLYDVWHILKFMCQEIHEVEARVLGVLMAAGFKRASSAEIERMRGQILRLLRRPVPLARIQAMAAKHYAYYRKRRGVNVLDLEAPDSQRAKRDFVEQLRRLEARVAAQADHFSGRPVVYRPSRSRS